MILYSFTRSSAYLLFLINYERGVILLEAKINSLFDRLFNVECEIMSIHKSAKRLLIDGGLNNDEWLRANSMRKKCINLLAKLND